MSDSDSPVPEREAEDGSGADGRTVPRESIDAAWADLFPFDPYPQQADGVERALDTMSDGGYLMLEGACGTGKTLIALVAGLQAVADGAGERVMAVTPVKQQLKQFVSEVQALVRNGADVDGLVMVGKRDLLPYARTGAIPGESVHEASSDMRETTARLVSRESRLELDVAPGALDGRINVCEAADCDRLSYSELKCPEHRGEREEDVPWYDPVRAAALCHLVEGMDGPRLETAGASAPYSADPPHTRDVLDIYDSEDLPAGDAGYFDPFYARYFADEEWIPFDFSAGEEGVLTPDSLVNAAVRRGTCPHEAMASLMGEADVLIGNYNHAFDPLTRRLTNEKAGVLDEETLLVVDEAHMLEERVRDLLSDSVSLHALRTAHRDVTLAREYLSGTGGEPGADAAAHRRHAEETLKEFESVTGRDLAAVGSFLEWVAGRIDDEVSEFLESEYGDWQRRFREGSLPEEDHEIPLRDPEAVETDRVTDAAEERFAGDIWARVRDAGYVVAKIHENDGQTDRTPVSAGVGRVLFDWGTADRGTYFRELELEFSEKAVADTTLPDWASAYNADLTLFNCIPRDPLAAVLDDLAGGVLMSATLEPFDVYRTVSGLDVLSGSGEPADSEESADGDREGEDREPRTVETASYGLAFPEANRESWVVDLPAFTYRNRGPPVTEYGEMTRTRKAYAGAMTTLARSHGNVLVCLPSYREAEWAVEYLRDHVEKPVLRDRSSEASETDEMLDRFFQRDGVDRVLVTSARGTVTEGVDYRGDRLHCAVVVGVPYANTATPRMKAVMNAYDRTFGEEGGSAPPGAGGGSAGFSTAVQVPAVRKARQAFGRVLRGPDESGVRVLLDERYLRDAPRSVNGLLGERERREFSAVSPDMLDLGLERFWSARE
ncbi:ATP-dependent DNA helicase [Halomarina litorea]|uniref:ATP-dependent DNA helicase n=1 Tax=Halomarina litorea TaxID=2961595 RepID=UPI0020C39C75|nr:ATP-dependent DNA helicase [Halomarina sp. BCD28]